MLFYVIALSSTALLSFLLLYIVIMFVLLYIMFLPLFYSTACWALKSQMIMINFFLFTHTITQIEIQTQAAAFKVSLRWVQMKTVLLISCSPRSFTVNWKEPFYWLNLIIKELFLCRPTSTSFTIWLNFVTFKLGIVFSTTSRLTGDSQPIWGWFERSRWNLVLHSRYNLFYPEKRFFLEVAASPTVWFRRGWWKKHINLAPSISKRRSTNHGDSSRSSRNYFQLTDVCSPKRPQSGSQSVSLGEGR